MYNFKTPAQVTEKAGRIKGSKAWPNKAKRNRRLLPIISSFLWRKYMFMKQENTQKHHTKLNLYRAVFQHLCGLRILYTQSGQRDLDGITAQKIVIWECNENFHIESLFSEEILKWLPKTHNPNYDRLLMLKYSFSKKE